MHRISFLLAFAIFTIRSFGQLDSLKGEVRFVADSISFINPGYGITLIHRELDFGQYSITEENSLQELNKKDLFTWILPFEKKERTFNQKGQLVNRTTFNRHYKIISTIDYRYDEYGNKVQEIRRYSGEDSESITTLNYRYQQLSDSAEHIMALLESYDDPEHFLFQQYFYDSAANLIEERELTSFGNDKKTTYQYDCANRLIRAVYATIVHMKTPGVNSSQVIRDTTDNYYSQEYRFNDEGLLMEEANGCLDSSNTKHCTRKLYSFDNQNRITSIHYYWKNNTKTSSRSYEYYPDNSIRKISWFSQGESVSRNVAEYHYQNKELRKLVLVTPEKTSVIEYRYEIDRAGNWTKQTRLLNGIVQLTRVRVIDYWD